MKSLILAFVLLTASLTNAVEIAPSLQPVQVPIVFTVVSVTTYSYTYMLKEQNDGVASRLQYDSYTREIYYHNSGGARVSATRLGDDQINRMHLILSRISRNCPVTFEVNSTTFQVDRITPTCNEYSEYGEIPSA